MLLVPLLALGLWGLGAALKAPHSARWTMIGLLLVAVMGLHVVLPDGHPLREATGGSPGPWLFLLGLVALVAGYRQILKVLRRSVAPENAPPSSPQRSGELGEVELE
ncbi:MAG: molybdopterin biosynthesis protein, partial [Planctomycetota bacterium]